jgi:hypothetical protein
MGTGTHARRRNHEREVWGTLRGPAVSRFGFQGLSGKLAASVTSRGAEVQALRDITAAAIRARMDGMTTNELAARSGHHEPWLQAVLDSQVSPGLDDLAEIFLALGSRVTPLVTEL